MNIQTKIAAEQQARPLTIRRADAIAIAVPLAKPIVMAAETITHAENLVVRLEAENGLVGWGEATVAPSMSGDTLPGMVAAVRQHLAPLLIGADVRDRAALARRCRAAMVHNGGAKAAVEIALTDLAGKHYGVPAVELIGGATRRAVDNMWLLANPTIDADIAEAKQKVGEGYSYFKLKVGVKKVEAEIDAALQARAALGPDVRLCADANTGWDPRTAKTYMRGVESVGLLYLEQPLPSDQTEAMGALNRLGIMPISGDECIGGSEDILALGQAGILGGVNLKVIKTEGIAPLLDAAALCKQLGLSATFAVKVASTSLGGAAMLAAACAAPVADWGVSLTHVYLAEDMVRDPLQLKDGQFLLRDAPGLGVDVDEDAVKRFTVSGA